MLGEINSLLAANYKTVKINSIAGTASEAYKCSIYNENSEQSASCATLQVDREQNQICFEIILQHQSKGKQVVTLYGDVNTVKRLDVYLSNGRLIARIDDEKIMQLSGECSLECVAKNDSGVSVIRTYADKIDLALLWMTSLPVNEKSQLMVEYDSSTLCSPISKMLILFLAFKMYRPRFRTIINPSLHMSNKMSPPNVNSALYMSEENSSHFGQNFDYESQVLQMLNAIQRFSIIKSCNNRIATLKGVRTHNYFLLTYWPECLPIAILEQSFYSNKDTHFNLMDINGNLVASGEPLNIYQSDTPVIGRSGKILGCVKGNTIRVGEWLVIKYQSNPCGLKSNFDKFSVTCLSTGNEVAYISPYITRGAPNNRVLIEFYSDVCISPEEKLLIIVLAMKLDAVSYEFAYETSIPGNLNQLIRNLTPQPADAVTR